MASKSKTVDTLIKNRKAIFDAGCTIHDEVLKASHLVIDETLNTITKSQKIAGKIIKEGEPIVAKQVEITIDAVAEVSKLASKGGKRALQLLGLTKQYDQLTKKISEQVDQIPSTEEIIDNAKEIVANAKSDVEKTITKATASIKKAANTAEKTVEAKADELAQSIKKVNSSKTIEATARKTKKVATKVTKVVESPKAMASKAASGINTATDPQKSTATDLTSIKGIGPSLAGYMQNNGIMTIADLQSATPAQLKAVAEQAGNRYASFDTTNWIKAANAMTQS